MDQQHDQHNNPWEDADHRAVTDDAWHAHSDKEEPPQESHGTTSPGAIALVGIGGFALLIIVGGIVHVYFDQVARQKYVENVERVDLGQATQTQLAEEEQRLSSYGWVNSDEGTVHIPVDLAMEKISDELANPE